MGAPWALFWWKWVTMNPKLDLGIECIKFLMPKLFWNCFTCSVFRCFEYDSLFNLFILDEKEKNIFYKCFGILTNKGQHWERKKEELTLRSEELKKKDLRWREQTTGKEYKGRKKTKAFMVAFMVSKKFWIKNEFQIWWVKIVYQ